MRDPAPEGEARIAGAARGVALAGIAKSFGDTDVLKNIDLEIEPGEFVVFVGPSGCGKSTLLRVIAGLEEPDAGRLTIGGEDMTKTPAAERGVAMVFQSYALYPHMTAFENMAFGLKLAKMPKPEVRRAVEAAAASLGIGHLLERRPRELSGGERQRVAIGRAIVRQPGVFLFDEPLSNLDAALRVRMRYEFARLHRELGTTMIYVTHDQTEAMTLARRIVVLSGGKIEQVGEPMALYHRPANRFVAGFIGSPRMNFLDGRLVAGGREVAEIELQGGETVRAAADASGLAAGTPVTLGIRPEHIAAGRGENRLAARVRFVEQLGGHAISHWLREGDPEPIVVQSSGAQAPRQDEAAVLGFSPSDCHVFVQDERALPRTGHA